MNPIRIANREVGTGRPAFVIAEAGVNHNGRFELAERLVDIAAEAGCDAVKFQTFDPELLATPTAAKAEYQRETTGEGGSQLEMLKALVLPRDAHVQLQRRAHDRGLVFLSTPFDEPSADFLEELGVPAFKVSSGDLTNVFLLKHLAAKRRPLLLSTGMATLDEVRAAVALVETCPLALFHCVSNYPAQPADCNLRAIATLRDATHRPVGWSDHTHGIDVTVAAVALGAELVEKHFTIDRTLPGPDHRASLEPDELAAMVRGIRNAEAALGDGIKQPRPSEASVAAVARRSLCYGESLASGVTLEERHLIALRPGTGIATTEVGKVVGRRLRRAVQRDQLVGLDDFEV
jgi:N-acetylneuraminate synthase/N,N'-diacetyllegionaminate synthase